MVAAIVAPELHVEGMLLKSPRCPAAAAPIISQTKRISVFLDKVPSGSSRACAYGTRLDTQHSGRFCYTPTSSNQASLQTNLTLLQHRGVNPFSRASTVMRPLPRD